MPGGWSRARWRIWAWRRRTMDRHIAWDIGVAALGEALAQRLDAPFVHQRLFAAGDRLQPRPGARRRDAGGQRRHADPGQCRPVARPTARRGWRRSTSPISRRSRRAAAAPDTILVALHSFTPRLATGDPRPWQAGILHDGGDTRFALRVPGGAARRAGADGRRQRAVPDGRDRLHVPRHAYPDAALCRVRGPAGSDRPIPPASPNGPSGWRGCWSARPASRRRSRGPARGRRPYRHRSRRGRSARATTAATMPALRPSVATASASVSRPSRKRSSSPGPSRATIRHGRLRSASTSFHRSIARAASRGREVEQIAARPVAVGEFQPGPAARRRIGLDPRPLGQHDRDVGARRACRRPTPRSIRAGAAHGRRS